MTRLLLRVREFAGSLAGRIALFLTLGMFCAALVAFWVADSAKRADIEHAYEDRAVASAVDVINRLQRDRADTESKLRNDGLLGARLVTTPLQTPYAPDEMLSAMVAARIPPDIKVSYTPVPSEICRATDPFWQRPRAAGFTPPIVPECALLRAQLPGAAALTIRIDQPRLRVPSSRAGYVFLSLVLGSMVLLAIAAAALVTAPLRRLSAASEAFARSIDAEPVPETGPTDVRQALATFNVMQERVRESLRERTRILAAISHDLQTPLTRLRLRLESVQDEALRERLVADLSATLAMVKRGLDLARSTESAEPWSTLDLDSLLSSMAEDATEFGQQVSFRHGPRTFVRVKPDALTRCLNNLIDNAVKYAGAAEINYRVEAREVIVEIRDRGPGISEDLLPRIFSPFVRGASGKAPSEGTGIGLTIARAQAAAIGGKLTLQNHPDGGAIAILNLPLAK